MKTFTIAKVNKLGELDDTYGQQFWADVSEQLEPVMFNLVAGHEVGVGDTITAETVELKTSKKGKDYHRLKKVKVVDGNTQPGPGIEVQTVRIDPIQPQLDRIEAKLDRLLDEQPVTSDPLDLDITNRPDFLTPEDEK